MDGNPGLGGLISTVIGDLSTLQSFSVAESGLTGVLPSEIGNLVDMSE
jgi:hypothetical protein